MTAPSGGPGRHGAALPHIAHVAVPFAHAGDPATNVIRRLCREHTALGGRSTVVLSGNRDTEVADADNVYVDHRRYCPREWFTPAELRVDHAAGLLGALRPHTSRLPIPGIEALAERRPDVVVVHEAHYGASALPRWREALPDSQLVLWVHASLSRAYRPRELRRLFAPLDLVVGVSEHTARRVRERAGGAAVPVRSVLNGTEPGQGADDPVGDLAGGGLRVLFIGRVSPEKGPHLLVEAVTRLLAEGRDVSARIIGSSFYQDAGALTPYEQRLREMAAPHGRAIEFLPFLPQPELVAHRRWASVICVPSVFEDPCPLVLLEALSAGRAVVATARGGIPEIGADSVRYVDHRDAGQLVDVLRRLSQEPDDVAALATAAAQRATELRWSVQHRRFLDLLEETSRS